MLVWGRQSTGFFGSGHCFHSYCSVPMMLFDLLRYAGLRPSISRTRSSASPCIRSSAHGSQPRFRLHGNGLRWNGPISVSVLWSKHCSGHVHPSSEAKPLSSLENCPLRDQARFNEPPQRHNQLARDRYDRNPAEAALRIRDTLAIPDGKPTFRLMPKPQPS